MKLQCAFFLAVVTLPAWQFSPIPPADKDPFVGEWQANPTKSRPKLNKKEATYRRSFRRQGEDLLLNSSGGKQKAPGHQYSIRCDGDFHAIATGPEQMCRYVSANRVEGETRNSGGV